MPLWYFMMITIQTTKQLNQFVVRRGLTTPTEIIKSLSGSQVIVSHSVARLIAMNYSGQILAE